MSPQAETPGDPPTASPALAPSRKPRVVVGGGVVGLATARALALADPAVPVVLLEKEPTLAAHQTGRNSGVAHSGLYYAPGSLKARTCRRGLALLTEYCAEHGVAFERCGKVVVAVDDAEQPRLAALAERGRANGVRLEEIGPERLRELEPHVAGVAALHVHDTGIVDYPGLCAALAEELRAWGGFVSVGVRVHRLEPLTEGVRVHVDHGAPLDAVAAVNCTGLFSDRIARASGADPGARIVPFRGEYYELTDAARSLCRDLVYPVPDPRFPFLGVHFTRMVGGGVECGPNAVLALAREGYRWRDVDLRDLAETFAWPGTWRLVARHWRTGCGEAWRSLSKQAFVRALQRLVPALEPQHLRRAPAGVRAQALRRDGALVDDFLVRRVGPVTHVVNAPSPAATASLAIGEHVAALATGRPPA